MVLSVRVYCVTYRVGSRVCSHLHMSVFTYFKARRSHVLPVCSSDPGNPRALFHVSYT